MKTEKVRFYVERSSFGVQTMTVLMALSVVFRIIGCWGLWNNRSYALTQIALPIAAALLFIACIWLLGKRALWVSFLPVVLGAVFFIIKSLGFESTVHTILCILLYTAVMTLYFCTVFGIIRTKWILVLLFALPFLYHIFVEDLAALRDTAHPVSFAAGMQEMGVLCIMLGLCFLALSMKKSVTEQTPHLPKIRKPKVVIGEKEPESEQEENTAGGETGAEAPSAPQTEGAAEPDAPAENGTEEQV